MRTKAQIRASRAYEERNPLRTSINTAIRQARRLGNAKPGSKLAQAIEKYPDLYEESILSLATLYSEKAKEIQGK